MTKKRLKEIADFAVTDDAPYETLEEAQEAMPTLTESKQMASALLEAREDTSGVLGLCAYCRMVEVAEAPR